jgi:hypothetical protein
VQSVAHEAIAIGLVGRVEVGIVEGVARPQEVRERLTGPNTSIGGVRKLGKVGIALRLRRERKHFEIQVVHD